MQRERFVLITSSNSGSAIGRPDLQYADDDGAKYYEFFSMLAPEENIVLLTKFDRDTAQLFPQLKDVTSDPTRQNLVAAAARLAKRTKAALRAGHEVEFYFVFAGHGDVDHGRGFIELQDGSFDADALAQHILKGVPATRTHVIADSCNSFFLIQSRKPGGKRFATPAQAVRKLANDFPHVGVFLSTNAEAEVFEWSELQSGIFSHAVRSGLAGAADADGDERVSYRELEAFVATAVADIPNPLYRPKVFAKAPKSRDVLANLHDAKAARIDIDTSTATRIALRDRDGLPWVDAHREAGQRLTLHLPQRIASGAWLEDIALVSGAPHLRARYALPTEVSEKLAMAELFAQAPDSEARGPARLFARLFLRPFGPKALAAFESTASAAPAPVFGISRADARRMEALLSSIGEIEERSRMMGTTGLVGIGALSLGAGIYFFQDNQSELALPVTLSTVGGISLIAGTIGIFRRTPTEKLREEFVAALARGEDPGAIVARTEKELYLAAKDYRETRTLMRWTGLAMAVAGTSMLVRNELAATPTASNRLSFAMLSLAGGWASFSSLYEYPIEKLVGLWEEDDDIQRLPRLSLQPLRGGTMVGVSGTF